MNENITINVDGHCLITDDLNNVILDQHNAVHPQNLSRVFARALANESNYFINRIAFGNGGTITDVAFNTTYKTPNDGQVPDIATYDSRLYNETFSKIINEGTTSSPNPLMGTDPGSYDNNGIRLGGGSVPTSDMVSIPHVSGPGVRSTELGTLSKVTIYATLNKDEPLNQYITDSVGTISSATNSVEDTESLFTFDEIGLYTAGGPAIPIAGYHHCDVGNKNSDDIALYYDDNIGNNSYIFGYKLSESSTDVFEVRFTIPSTYINGSVTYGELCEAINSSNSAWNFGTNVLSGAKITITDVSNTGAYTTITGDQTNGFLTLISDITGSNSYVKFVKLPSGSIPSGYQDLFVNLNDPIGADIISNTPVKGIDAGYQNSPTIPNNERERLLTHLIFSPIRKTKNRRFNITYTLTINVARTPNNNTPI